MKVRPCLIIGASGDIGQAIARRLRDEGRPVALTHSPKSSPAQGLENEDGKVRWYPVDVRSAASVTALAESVYKDFKAPPDLVYAAGITRDSSIALINDEVWDDVIGTNLSGAFYATRAVLRPLMMAGNGRIIYIGSVTGAKANAGQFAYGATKGALSSMCRIAALELGRFGITCNVVAPGAIEGRMIDQVPPSAVDKFIKGTPLKRLGKPYEVAALVSYILSPDAQYLTGQTIYIDGGLSSV